MSDLSYKIIVGLEIHVQLNTKTKIFCGCELAFGGQPNTRVCPVCIGMPGGIVVASSGMIGFAAMISSTEVLKCAAMLGSVSPL